MNKNDEVKTRLVFENDNNRYIWESPYVDASMEDILDAFFGMMVSATWQPETIIEVMRNFAEDHSYMLDDDDEFGCPNPMEFDEDDGCGCSASEFEKDVDEEEVNWPKKRNIAPAPHFYA